VRRGCRLPNEALVFRNGTSQHVLETGIALRVSPRMLTPCTTIRIETPFSGTKWFPIH
jgi:hypothetical protein